jgi:malate dehydrogenase (oxaloacetate-decarboxylating)(NADP+)
MNKYKEALIYHQYPNPGKISTRVTKDLKNQNDLVLAYSPGVAGPCLEIAKNIDDIYKYTSKGNIVAVISNGTAILGLGDLGAAASKPVMEGKAALFKKFGYIDAIDLEIDEKDPEKFIEIVKSLENSFGAINLEDISAPNCFIIEEKLKDILNIPVLHDDQHGTATVILAALINCLYITGKSKEHVKIIMNGAGAAAIACLDLLVYFGFNKSNIILCDTQAVVYKGRKVGMNQWKEKYATESNARSLLDAIENADIFLGLSKADILTSEMLMKMAKDPMIFAMANPDPEINPEIARSVRPDAIIATGRSDYPNQINNVLCFPYIFRGALDVRAKTINKEMQVAVSNALAEIARLDVPNSIYNYGYNKLSFGREYIVPVPFDERLIVTLPVEVARAAIKSRTSQIDNFDLDQYKKSLEEKTGK